LTRLAHFPYCGYLNQLGYPLNHRGIEGCSILLDVYVQLKIFSGMTKFSTGPEKSLKLESIESFVLNVLRRKSGTNCYLNGTFSIIGPTANVLFFFVQRGKHGF
jgi:hypothetical protein